MSALVLAMGARLHLPLYVIPWWLGHICLPQNQLIRKTPLQEKNIPESSKRFIISLLFLKSIYFEKFFFENFSKFSINNIISAEAATVLQ